MKDMLRACAVLFAITFVAAVCLGIVYNITLEPIANQQAIAKAEAMNRLLPSALSFEEVQIEENGAVLGLTVGYSEAKSVPVGAEPIALEAIERETLAGFIISVTSKGYGGSIELLVALNADGVVEGVDIIEHNETPGLGANADNALFTSQYAGKTGEFFVTKNTPGDNEIQAITSATVTSRAVTDAVNAAQTYFNGYLRGGEQ